MAGSPTLTSEYSRATANGSRKNKLAFWRERRAGRCKAPRPRRCGDIVEERQRRRYVPFAAAPRRAAGPHARQTMQFTGYHSIGHGGPQQNAKLLLREP